MTRLLTYRDPFVHKTACEVTCDWCGHVFQVTRLRRGHLKCPLCLREARGALDVPRWRQVPIVE